MEMVQKQNPRTKSWQSIWLRPLSIKAFSIYEEKINSGFSWFGIVMGPGQKFLTQVGSIFCGSGWVGSGQPFMV